MSSRTSSPSNRVLANEEESIYGHMVNTLSGANGEGPGSTRSLSLSKYPRSYSRKVTCRSWSSTSRMPTAWPTNTVERLILRLPNQAYACRTVS